MKSYKIMTKKLIRCKSTLVRLEEQLKSGVKTTNNSGVHGTTPLTKKDIKRINEEINILITKLKGRN
jgi:hypothetical protein